MLEQVTDLAVRNTKTTLGALAISSVVAIMVFASSTSNIQAQSSVCIAYGTVSEENATLAADCETLLGMKKALRGTAILNWWVGRPIDRWDGIGVHQGRVSSVVLPSQGLDGIIPPAFEDLTALNDLDLSNNSLTGTIPSELGNLTSLTWWRLAGNNLTGCVPEQLGQVTDNDLDALGLQLCGTVAPPPPSDELSDLMASANCTADDLSSAFLQDFVMTDDPILTEWGTNTRGWSATYLTLWETESETTQGIVTCFTILFGDTVNAFHESQFHSIRLWNDFSFLDTYLEVKMKELDTLGDDFMGMHEFMNDALFPDSSILQVNSVLYRRSNIISMLTSSNVLSSDGNAFPFLDERISEVAKDIDDRLEGLRDTSPASYRTTSPMANGNPWSAPNELRIATEALYKTYEGTGIKKTDLPAVLRR